VDEAIGRFDCGMSARHGEPEAIAGFIRALMHDAEKHAALREKARAGFDSAYNDRRTLSQFEQLLHDSR